MASIAHAPAAKKNWVSKEQVGFCVEVPVGHGGGEGRAGLGFDRGGRKGRPADSAGWETGDVRERAAEGYIFNAGPEQRADLAFLPLFSASFTPFPSLLLHLRTHATSHINLLSPTLPSRPPAWPRSCRSLRNPSPHSPPQDVRYLVPIVNEIEAENTERAFWDNVVIDKSKH